MASNSMSKLLAECTNVEPSNLSRGVKLDYSLLSSDQRVKQLKVYGSSDNFYEIIAFDFRFETTGNPVDKRIKWPEKIIIRYPRISKPNPIIFSGRDDFPIDLPHLNAYGSNYPASFCLWRSGTHELYRDLGIHGILYCLSNWLKDAELNRLQPKEDGWEPTPRSGDMKFVTFHSNLQELGYDLQENNITLYGGHCTGSFPKDPETDKGGILGAYNFKHFNPNPKVRDIRATFKRSSNPISLHRLMTRPQ